MADVNYSCPSCAHSFRIDVTKRFQACCPECGRQLEWVFLQGTQKCGPVSGSVFQQMLKRGELDDHVQVRQEGSNVWTTVQTINRGANEPGQIPRAILVEKKATHHGTMIPAAHPVVESWYVDRDKQTFGPVSVEQLQQLAANGQLRPQDMVLKAGTTQWGEARTVAQLKFEQSPTSPPLVPCERCGSRISDVAELCPQCGHPQPKVPETAFGLWWHREADCKNCGTKNIIDFSRAGVPNQIQRCRGCMRALNETNEGDYVQHEMDRVYRNSIERSCKGRQLYGFLSFVSFFIFARLVPTTSMYLGILLSLTGAICVNLLSEYLVRRHIQRTGAMAGLFGEVSPCASKISSGDASRLFSQSAKNYEAFKQAEKKLGLPDYQATTPCSLFVIWASILCLLAGGLYLYEVKEIFDNKYQNDFTQGVTAGREYARECNENGTLNNVAAHQLPSNPKKSAGWNEGFRRGVLIEHGRIYEEKTKQ